MTLVLVGIPALFWGEKTFKNRGQKGARQVYMHTYLEFCSDCRIRVDSKNPGRSSWGDFLHENFCPAFFTISGVFPAFQCCSPRRPRVGQTKIFFQILIRFPFEQKNLVEEFKRCHYKMKKKQPTCSYPPEN